VQVGRVGFARVELHQNTLPRKIDSHIPDSVYFHEYRAKFAHAFVAIFTLGGDLDCFNDIVIGTFRIERVAGFGFVWSRWVHHSLNVRRGGWACNFPRDWFKNAPDIPGKDTLPGRVRVDAVGQIQ
jgi:hypothetical protein